MSQGSRSESPAMNCWNKPSDKKRPLQLRAARLVGEFAANQQWARLDAKQGSPGAAEEKSFWPHSLLIDRQQKWGNCKRTVPAARVSLAFRVRVGKVLPTLKARSCDGLNICCHFDGNFLTYQQVLIESFNYLRRTK